jgi:hypothetical protein
MFPKKVSFAKVGFGWLLTAPGQPIIYYGQEQGFNSKCPDSNQINAGSDDANKELLKICGDLNDHPLLHSHNFHPFYRQDMYEGGPFRLGSAVDTLDAKKGIDLKSMTDKSNLFKGDWSQDPMLPRDHELYKFVRNLAKLRRTCPVLVSGITKWGIEGYDQRPPRALMVYSRVSKDMEIVIVINPNEESTTHYQFACDPKINSKDQVYRDVLDADPFQTFKVQIKGDGKCYLNPEKYNEGRIDPFTVRILVHEDKLIKKEGSNDVLYGHPAEEGSGSEYKNLALCANLDESRKTTISAAV